MSPIDPTAPPMDYDPGHDGPRFFRPPSKRGRPDRGRVHVFARAANAAGLPTDASPDAVFAWNLGMGRQIAVCGYSCLWHEAAGVSEFPDGDLCASCHRLYPGDSDRLFEHPQ